MYIGLVFSFLVLAFVFNALYLFSLKDDTFGGPIGYLVARWLCLLCAACVLIFLYSKEI